MQGEERLTQAEQHLMRTITGKVRRTPPPPAPPPEEGMAGDLTAIALSEISKLLASARENAFQLLKPAELIALLELTLRLPPPSPEAQGELDLSALSVDELRFLVACGALAGWD